ncbi:chaplin family protein [Streptomyces sp. NPDC008092]|uniref:chaplin n=1 Tax=Streptomyces sp. NPDC008092 TaxID=3364808 RepID=UPI0036E04D59
MAVASGAMAVAGTAHADSAAEGTASNSPGLASGNNIQLPVDIPVNVCGNTVDVIGLLNPAMGNKCANEGHKAPDKAGSRTSGRASAEGTAHDSPGVLSGDLVQIPVDVPVNLSGNSANLVGILNPVFGNESSNGSDDQPDGPGPSTPTTPRVHQQPHHPAEAHPRTTVVRQRTTGTLAQTGATSPWAPAAVSLASLAAGAVLYRRFRPGTGSASYV